MKKSIFLFFAAILCAIGTNAATDLYLRGIGTWDAKGQTKMTASGSTYSLVVYLAKSTTYEFKIADSGWTYNNTYAANNSNENVSLDTEYQTWHDGGKGNMKFTPSADGFYNFSLTSGKLTISHYNPIPTAAPAEVVNGTNVMFYIMGYPDNNFNVLRANSSHNIDSHSHGICKGVDGYSYVNTAKTNLSTNTYVSNNPGSWNGVENTGIKDAEGGELFKAASTVSTVEAKKATTTTSITGDNLNISTTPNSTTGVLNGSLYIQYYLEGDFIGVTYNSAVATYESIKVENADAKTSTYNISELAYGTYTLKTVLTDGIVYYIADEDQFTKSPNYNLTVTAGKGISIVSGSTDPITLNYTYPITAEVMVGYQFEKWVASPEENGEFTKATEANTNVLVKNGSVTVTASAIEIMSTLTTANTYDKGTPTIAKPTTSAAEIGIATTSTVTAATNEDYVVASWTLENCVRTDAGGTNANTITVKAKGDGAAATVTANYEMIKYYIAGSLPAITWTPGNHALTENSGVHSMTFTNLPAGSYEFKITKGASWATQWGYDDLDFPYDGVSGSGDDGQNIKITLSEAKTITIKFNSSTKKISLDGLTPLIKQNLKYTVTVPKGTTKCYLVGLGDWNNFREMTQDPGNNRIFTLTVNDVYVTDEYKYSASKNWNNAEVDVNNNDVGNRKWSESDVVAKWKGIDLVPEALTYTVTVPAGTEECYIAGTMNGWVFAAMEKSTTTPNTFTIDIANANEAHEYKYACKKNWDYAEVNADGSSVSNRTYSANDVVAKWGFPTYTVAGDNRIVFGEEWKETLTDNDMVDQGDGTYKWTKSEIALKKNTKIKFQVVKNHSWENKWPNDPWVINTISQDGYYTITIIFKESDQSITVTVNWTGEAPFKDFSNQPATLYFHPSFHWTSDNAEFAAYFYNEGFGADAEPKWADMTDSDGDGVYEVANAKQHEYVIICRMNPDRTENKWDDAVSWNKIETGITIPNTAGNLNTCIAFWKNSQGDVPTSECTWVAPTPLTDKNWDAFVAAYNGKTINAVVERSFKSGQYHTLCLPFDIPTNWLGEGTKAYQLTSIVANNTGDKLSLNATLWNTIVAGQPYIIVPVKGSEYEHVIINGVTVKNVSAGTNVASGAGYKATLKAVTATDGTKTNGTTEYYVGANDGKLYNAEVYKLGLRALIELTTTSGQPLPAKVRAYVAAEENEATGFENIVAPEGQALKVIENGQLIIIRGNEKFNAQGVRL